MDKDPAIRMQPELLLYEVETETERRLKLIETMQHTPDFMSFQLR